MSNELVSAYIDLTPNLLAESIAEILRANFERGLSNSVERNRKLPILMTLNPDNPYRELLVETRNLFIAGYFYSCVAMCGIVGERLIKDVFRTSILININGRTERPADSVFDQLERVETSGIINFLKQAGLLSENAAEEAIKLGRLRNDYAHSRGKTSETDSIKAINMLHAIIEGTVSIFKDFELKDGKFVPKSTIANNV